ncbi:MAG: D-alanine--D-alanine ligase [Xanthomonadales bacterium]|jgi:D-alanine-D-alanine ligase|nr:D-alanine--D-alanine ligase [Xanthomonadales bacterium]
MKISDPRHFGRVGVLMGGRSSERQVSLDSGAGVLAALQGRGIDAAPIDGLPELIAALSARRIDRVFNVLHGCDGEDGVVQGLLAAYGIPCTGSGVLASALTMDKAMTKRLFDAAGLRTCAWGLAHTAVEAEAVLGRLGLPLIAKPIAEGSTVGVSRIAEQRELLPAYHAARRYGPVLLERLVSGHECTVAVLAGQALPPIRIVPEGGFYDYHAKYLADSTGYLIPTGIGQAVDSELARLAEAAFAITGCIAWARVDFMVDHEGLPWLLEINTVPGMTSHSLVPKAAAAVGIDYAELCWRILEMSVDSGATAGGT